jgi:hypothetical protein
LNNAFDRLTKVIETVGSKSFTTETEYDALGRERKHIYPSGYYTINWYDVNGFLTGVTDQHNVSLWQALEENAKGQLTRVNRGGRETTYGFDTRGFPTSIQSVVFHRVCLGNISGKRDESGVEMTKRSQKMRPRKVVRRRR